MPYSTENSFTGDGSTTDFTITFPFIEAGDIKARVDGTTTTAFSITGTTISFTTAPANTKAILVYRDTDIDRTKVTFQTGASVRAQDLNALAKQLLYAIQEEEQNTGTEFDLATGDKNHLTVNTANDWTIDNNVITKAMMTVNSVDSDQYVDSSIDTVHIANHQVTYPKIQNIATANRVLGRASAGEVQEVQVTNDMIADLTINLEDKVNHAETDKVFFRTEGGSGGAQWRHLTTNTLEDNAVTEAKIADAAVTAFKTPVGTVIWYAGSSAPTGYLKCNGDTIANGSGTTQGITADFSALHAVTGATLPDLRGEFVRGWDDGKGTDSGRTIRSTQADEFKSHQHTSDGARFGSNSTHPGDNFYSSGGDNTGVNTVNSINATGGTETRPRNIALLACIKY